jgi:hypothetical protein
MGVRSEGLAADETDWSRLRKSHRRVAVIRVVVLDLQVTVLTGGELAERVRRA